MTGRGMNKIELKVAYEASDKENTLMRFALRDMHFIQRGAGKWDYETSAAIYYDGEETEVYQIYFNRLTSASGGYVLMISGLHAFKIGYLDDFYHEAQNGRLQTAFLDPIYRAYSLRGEMLNNRDENHAH
jgi:hypothetical protein